jgi:hypothetical protein
MTNLPTQTPWKRIVTAMAKNPAYNSRRTNNRLPTPKTKKHHKQRFYRFVSSILCGNQSSPPTDEHPFISRRNHTHLTQKASRVLVSKVGFGCRAYSAKRSS